MIMIQIVGQIATIIPYSTVFSTDFLSISLRQNGVVILFWFHNG